MSDSNEAGFNGQKVKSPMPRKILSRLEKGKILNEIDSGKYTKSEAREKYRLQGHSPFGRWRKQLSRGPVSKVHFSEQLKLRVVREINAGILSIAEAKKKFNIHGNDTLKRWLRKYDSTTCEPMKKNAPFPEEERFDPMGSDPEKQILIKELKEAKLKILGLETLIEVAEEELEIQIRKKSGTKRSKG